MTDKIRKCIGCSKLFPRNAMFRILKKYNDNSIVLDPTNKDFGRSVYICKNTNCINNAFKKGKIGNILKFQTPAKLKTLLEEKLKE